ncbi:MAG: Crp/Fnr family transcriptional regulator [Oscillospiraceae bacterium]
MLTERLNDILSVCAGNEAKRWISSFWEVMDDEVRAMAVVTKKRPGTVIIQSGAKPEKVYFLLRGTVKIHKELPDGVLYEIDSVKAPCLFGETEAITDAESSRATVCTKDECAWIALRKETFLRWMQTSNRALFQVTRLIITKNFNQQSKDRTMLFSHGFQRLAYRLLSYYEETGDATVTLEISRERLSEDTGLNIRSISRALNRLEEQQMIGRSGRKILISAEQSRLMKRAVSDESGLL